MTYSSMGIGRFAGIRIIEDSNLTVETQDWSGVRSPGRARRRLKRGFRQNIVYGRKPDPNAYSIDKGRTLIMHPVTYEAVKQAIATEILPPAKPTQPMPMGNPWIIPHFPPTKYGYFFNNDIV